ncbi:uncharacterized protein FIESC28_07386 [Fusarium coffeatum]|uniref:L-type lectin-like domain-containing protein n=1 Tax=Fusarium coffeatum TaxID=231269 RepID=A0A366REX2_9HYPO|nr:uncharacterized protein FIESC28_07386 [Fusarium coffeatum]RBR15372.1 hypothetical protein FIESC28_07386 [Fusarium coffeatum]
MVLSTMNAMVVEVPENGSKPELIKKQISPPMLEPHEVLVKVATVAQNPTDVQAFDLNLFGNGAVLGCDFAGKVERLGKDVTKVAEGDTIAGLLWGGEIKGLGAYSEYTKAHESICFKVPKSISLPEAATIPLASLTAWLALFSRDSLNIDRNKPDNTVLIWGGSSSVGQYAIQIASMFGFKTITTCSPHSFDLVKSFGATHVFDYNDSNVVKSIKDVAPDLKYVFDTIGNKTSSATASEAIDENGGTLCTVRPDKSFTENVTKQTRVTPVLVWTAFNRVIQYKKASFPASEEDHKLGIEFNDKLPGWIDEGKIKPNKPKVLGGLDAIPQGFQEHRDALRRLRQPTTVVNFFLLLLQHSIDHTATVKSSVRPIPASFVIGLFETRYSFIMRLSSLSAALLGAFAWTTSAAEFDDENIRSISPYLDSDMQSRWYDFGGDTIIRTDSYIRLTSDRPSQSGWMYSRVPLTATNWQIEVEFKISGKNQLYGDGFAMWITRQRAQMGTVFGGPDNFEGLGVFIDTYKNNRPGVVFPYVMAMYGDGKTSYDKSNDGKHTELAGCSARGIRHASIPTKLRLTYFQDKQLKLELQYKVEDEWQTCFDLEEPPAVPNIAYVGFTAETGELSDNHDIISVAAKNLYTQPGSGGNTGGKSSSSKSKSRKGTGKTTTGQKQGSSWTWFFTKIILFIIVAGGAYVGYTAYRSKAKSHRF